MFYFTLRNLLFKFGIYSEGSGEEIKGIDGWLLIPLLKLALYPIFTINEIITSIIPLTSPQIWSALTNETSQHYNAFFAPFVVFVLISKFLLMFFAAVVFYFFIKKSHRLPNLFINFLAAAIFIAFIEALAIDSLSTSTENSDIANNFIKNIIFNGFWVFYFLKSKRVKNTFTNKTSLTLQSTGTVQS